MVPQCLPSAFTCHPSAYLLEGWGIFDLCPFAMLIFSKGHLRCLQGTVLVSPEKGVFLSEVETLFSHVTLKGLLGGSVFLWIQCQIWPMESRGQPGWEWTILESCAL